MAHHCPTCSEPCYCMGDYDERMTGQPAYCKHCTDYSKIEDDEKLDMGECCADCGSIDYCEPWCSLKNTK